MSQLQIQKHTARSSPEKRAAARAKLAEVRQRLEEAKAAQTSWAAWVEPLVKAARFVVDVNGDPPSMDQLRAAVAEAERQQALARQYVALRKERERLEGEANYYQYAAGRTGGMAGFAFFHVLGQGDTRKEALEKAHEE